MRRQDKYQDTNTFHYYNANPKNKITGDCVVRAISVALYQTYEETYQELFLYSLKTGYMLNDKKNYEKYLASKGWLKKAQPKHPLTGNKYTGVEFCLHVQECTFDFSSRMLAHIGGHHIVAIVNGRVWDTWNSTGYCVGNYWVLP